ncbi:MAG: bacteriophage holin [Acidiferrobacterales bacterium]
MNKIDAKALAIALGSAWGLMLLFVGWAAMFGWSTKFVEIMASTYIGFEPSFLGGIIGGIWGFVDGAIGGFIIAIIYNAVAKK